LKCLAIHRPAIAIPTLVAAPWPRGPVVVSTPALELPEASDVVECDGQLAQPFVFGVDRLDAREVQHRVQEH
jgi:hypothetical protein